MAQNSLLRGKTDDRKRIFQLFFLKDNEDESIEVTEVEEIDFIEVLRHLEQGNSIFIAPKRNQKFAKNPIFGKVSGKDLEEPWYFTHT